MNILVDMDGILTDTLPAWLNRVYELTGVRAFGKDIKDWNLHKNPPLTDLKPNQIFDVLNEKGFTLSLPEMPEAFSNLKRLKEDGHDVSILTARYGDNCMPETIQWLVKNVGSWFDVEKKTWFCYDKARIVGDVLIDDKAETLIRYRQEHPQAKLITIDYPYNQGVSVDYRVPYGPDAWDQIREYIQWMNKKGEINAGFYQY